MHIDISKDVLGIIRRIWIKINSWQIYSIWPSYIHPQQVIFNLDVIRAYINKLLSFFFSCDISSSTIQAYQRALRMQICYTTSLSLSLHLKTQIPFLTHTQFLPQLQISPLTLCDDHGFHSRNPLQLISLCPR